MHDRRRRKLDLVVWGIGVGFLVALVAATSEAATPTAPDAAAPWREECGSCHIAYPARFLPAASWRVLLERLDRHFGVDATIDPAHLAAIRPFLETHAAPPGGTASGTDTPRISTAPWFVREHAEVAAQVWRRPSVRSRANCAACHTTAEQGVFSDDGIRIPR